MATAKQRATARKRELTDEERKEQRRRERAAQKEADRLARIAAREEVRKRNRQKLDEQRAQIKPEVENIVQKALKPSPIGLRTRITVEQMTQEQLDYFAEQVALGIGVTKVVAGRPDFPSEYAMWKAIADEQSIVAKIYARSKQIAVAKIEEEIIEIAKTPHIGTTLREAVTKDGDVVELRQEGDMIGHRTLVVDTLKWQLAHIRPKKHGRNPETGGGEENNQLKSLFDALMKGPAPE